MANKPRAKTVYIPGEGSWQWRNYSIDMRNTLLPVPKTKTGKWTQAAIRHHYFPGMTERQALDKVHRIDAEWRANSDKYRALGTSSTKTAEAARRRLRKSGDALYSRVVTIIAAYEFAYKPPRDYGPERKDSGTSAPSYFRKH